jgi:hypothetical protein
MVLPLFLIIGHFGIFRFIAFATYLDIHLVYMHNKNGVFRKKRKTSYNLNRLEYSC